MSDEFRFPRFFYVFLGKFFCPQLGIGGSKKGKTMVFSDNSEIFPASLAAFHVVGCETYFCRKNRNLNFI